MDWFAVVEFREPLALWLAVLAVPIAWAYRSSAGVVVFSSLSLIPGTSSWRVATRWVPDALLALALVAFVVALAGPRIGERTIEINRDGIAIMMVVDVSGSMQALDLSTQNREQTRLDAVKEVFAEFVLGSENLPGRPNDAIGLVQFAGFADTSAPLTLDHANLANIAAGLEINTDRRESGTAIGDAIGLAVERLRESQAESKIVLLLTDGVNNAGVESPEAAAELARSQSIKVYTIGAGTNGMAPVRLDDPRSGRSVLRRVPVEIDEETLKTIAERTGGRYFRATDRDELTDVYAEIDRLERVRLNEERTRQFDEYFALPLLIALLCAILGWLLRATLYRRLPE